MNDFNKCTNKQLKSIIKKRQKELFPPLTGLDKEKLTIGREDYQIDIEVALENDELNRSLLQERMAEMKSSEKALELQAKEDNEFMQMVVSDKLGMIRRSFPSWMHEEEERAAYMPSIDTVKERSTVLDKYNTVKTKMAWIALKFPEKDWEMWLKRETII